MNEVKLLVTHKEPIPGIGSGDLDGKSGCDKSDHFFPRDSQGQGYLAAPWGRELVTTEGIYTTAHSRPWASLSQILSFHSG